MHCRHPRNVYHLAQATSSVVTRAPRRCMCRNVLRGTARSGDARRTEGNTMTAASHYLAVFIGGGIGSALRYGVGRVSFAIVGPNFPAGTLGVNVIGCFLMGALAGWLAFRSIDQVVLDHWSFRRLYDFLRVCIGRGGTLGTRRRRYDRRLSCGVTCRLHWRLIPWAGTDAVRHVMTMAPQELH